MILENPKPIYVDIVGRPPELRRDQRTSRERRIDRMVRKTLGHEVAAELDLTPMYEWAKPAIAKAVREAHARGFDFGATLIHVFLERGAEPDQYVELGVFDLAPEERVQPGMAEICLVLDPFQDGRDEQHIMEIPLTEFLAVSPLH